MTRNLISQQYALEPDICSLFGSFIGAGETTALRLDVTGGTAAFTVGDVVTGGTSAAHGVVRQILSSTGVWNVATHTGAATLVLDTLSGTFQAETVTGAISGSASSGGAGTAAKIEENPTSVKGKGVASVVGSGLDGDAGKVTITLQDAWAGLLSFSECVIDGGTPDDWEMVPTAETVASTKVITAVVYKGGVATTPPSTAKVCFELVLATKTSVPAGF